MKGATSPAGNANYRIVELTDLTDLPPVSARSPVFSAEYKPPPTNMVGAGDVLDISIYEAGVTLFGGIRSSTSAPAASFDPSAQVERLPGIKVDDAGNIVLPFAGRLRAAGYTSSELASVIERAYRRMSQNPQVLVSIRDVIENSIIIGGEVTRPGRLVLPTNRETISDAIALANGYRGEMKDLTVRLQRQETSMDFRLSDVLADPSQDLRVFPGDKLSIVRAPRSFSVMGAPGRVEQVTFPGATISLAEAVAMAGGVNPNVGDPAAIFVFRFQQGADGIEAPVVYHLNLMKGGAYFLSQRFAMHDKDVLYIGNAEANQPSKLIQIISQLFAPIVTVRDVVRSAN